MTRTPQRTATTRTATTRISAGGRIVIPADFRAALNLDVGDSVALSCEDGELRVTSVAERIRRVQEHAAKHTIKHGIKPGSVVDEFLRERREAAALE